MNGLQPHLARTARRARKWDLGGGRLVHHTSRLSAIPGVPLAARRQAMVCAARALHTSIRPLELPSVISVAGVPLAALVTWGWPGVLRVYTANGRTLLVQSLPGRPFDADPGLETQAMCPLSAAAEGAPLDCRLVLQQAAWRVFMKERLPRVALSVSIGGSSIKVLAVWHWPGLVRMFVATSKEFMGQSLPGEPFELDESAP